MQGYAQKRNAVVERREALQSRGEIKGVLPIIPEVQVTGAVLVARAASTSSKKISSTSSKKSSSSSKKTSTTSSKTAAATSVKAAACVASDPVLAAIKNNFGMPLAFCQWWVGASYKSTSPISGVTPADITRVCACVKATPALVSGTQTKAMASPTGVSKVAYLDAFRKLVAQPIPFCNFWSDS
jgi:hypothetical protein